MEHPNHTVRGFTKNKRTDKRRKQLEARQQSVSTAHVTPFARASRPPCVSSELYSRGELWCFLGVRLLLLLLAHLKLYRSILGILIVSTATKCDFTHSDYDFCGECEIINPLGQGPHFTPVFLAASGSQEGGQHRFRVTGHPVQSSVLHVSRM